MRELIVRDDRELRRIEATIATILRDDPTSARLSRHCLLQALRAEREELLRVHGRGRDGRLPRAKAA